MCIDLWPQVKLKVTLILGYFHHPLLPAPHPSRWEKLADVEEITPSMSPQFPLVIKLY